MKPVSAALSLASHSPEELRVVTWTRYVPGSVNSVKNSWVFSSTVAVSVELPEKHIKEVSRLPQKWIKEGVSCFLLFKAGV